MEPIDAIGAAREVRPSYMQPPPATFAAPGNVTMGDNHALQSDLLAGIHRLEAKINYDYKALAHEIKGVPNNIGGMLALSIRVHYYTMNLNLSAACAAKFNESMKTILAQNG